jgi:hypothetical protein
MMRSAATLAVVVAIAAGGGLAAARAPSSQPPPCSLGGLKIFTIDHPSEPTDDDGPLVVFAAKSANAKPCSLTGRPKATTETSTGRVVGVYPWMSNWGHAVVTAKYPAYLLFFDPGECAVANQGPPFYVEITVLSSREELRITGLGPLPDRCGALGESAYTGY